MDTKVSASGATAEQTPRQPHPLPSHPTTGNFLSIEDFMKQQDAIDHVKSQELKAIAAAKLANSRPGKKNRRPIDEAAIAAEARAVAELGDTNWTGRLGEYRAANPTAATIKGLEYFESASPTGKFICTVRIIEANHQFGDPTLGFSVKKQARQYASKKAIDWLIFARKMPADGSVKFQKPSQQAQVPNSKIIGPKIPPNVKPKSKVTIAGQVPEMCIRLGFGMPTYKIESIAPDMKLPMYKGYAFFPGEVKIQGKIGELAEPVHGQKAAKEEIAKVVLSFLKDIERQRAEGYESNESLKRKRSTESLERGTPGKSAKKA